MKLAIIGSQGSGKGTQSGYICVEYDVTPISTGDMLRDHVRRGTGLGRVAEDYMKTGELVPDHIIIELIREKLPSCDNRFLFDGFPRNVSQAEQLAGITSLDKVISIVLPREVAIQRLSGRYTSEDGIRIYNINSATDRLKLNIEYGEGGVVVAVYERETGNELLQRQDDTPKGIERRLEIFNNATKPVIDSYRHVLVEVDGSPKPEEVFAQIKQELDALKW